GEYHTAPRTNVATAATMTARMFTLAVGMHAPLVDAGRSRQTYCGRRSRVEPLARLTSDRASAPCRPRALATTVCPHRTAPPARTRPRGLVRRGGGTGHGTPASAASAPGSR